MLIPDKYKRTVRLQVRIKDGEWILVDGSPLPKLKDDTPAEIILSAHALLEANDQARWTAEDRRSMFSAGTTLWAVVLGPNGPIKADGCVSMRTWAGEPVSAVEVLLKEDLLLIRRPGKAGLLDSCKCSIPAVSLEVGSVNEAYTRISEKYEKHRRSHTGNVFQRVFYLDGDLLRPLEDRRKAADLE